MRISVLPGCTGVHHTHAWCARRSEEAVSSLELGPHAGGGFKLPCGCWELNLSPRQGQPVLLTAELTPYGLISSGRIVDFFPFFSCMSNFTCLEVLRFLGTADPGTGLPVIND